jgi:hypothetical protein
MMDPKVKRDWIDALRSGKYKQTRSKLCNKDGFCCLGVLADVAISGDWVEAPNSFDGRWNFEPDAFPSRPIGYSSESTRYPPFGGKHTYHDERYKAFFVRADRRLDRG